MVINLIQHSDHPNDIYLKRNDHHYGYLYLLNSQTSEETMSIKELLCTVKESIFVTIVALFVVIGIFMWCTDSHSTPIKFDEDPEVLFSPQDHVTNFIIKQINESKHTIRVLCYSFTSKPISDALIAAYKRGVDVRIISDGGQTDPYRTYVDDCANAGIPCFYDTKYKTAHDKVMVFDNTYILTGSFNFTNAAETVNSENVLFGKSINGAKLYTDRWTERLKTTTPIISRTK